MPNVYTRTGDRGMTGLFGGSRVPKQDLAVEAYGTVDEANSSIGEAKAASSDPMTREQLQHIQRRLFVLAAELASDAAGRAILDNTIDDADVSELEGLIDRCLAVTGPQRAFVVPGRDPESAVLHRARTVTRRAERRILALGEREPVRPEVISYMNRLSDALYALARLAEHRHDLGRVEGLVRGAVQRALGPDNREAPAPDELATVQFVVPHYDLGLLKVMAGAAETKALELGVPVVFAGVDAGGNLMLLHRMAGSLLASIQLATDKAFTSAAFQRPTAGLKSPSAVDGELTGIQHSLGGRVIVFAGGLPVFVGSKAAGGVGVSGGTAGQDAAIVRHAVVTAQEASQS